MTSSTAKNIEISIFRQRKIGWPWPVAWDVFDITDEGSLSGRRMAVNFGATGQHMVFDTNPATGC
jgi:hypothetical protein